MVDAITNFAPAAAGLRGTRRNPQGDVILGDVIVGIDQEPVGSLNDLTRLLDQHNVGDTVHVVIVRNGRRVLLPVTLQDLHEVSNPT